ncbi:hypothetical protein FEF27_09730 [Nesterenkonia sphaerica]|uniref:Transcriptional regulator, AbiEi antitoxin, Type IV TA system n=2 Tax=Nesterenkonia sphaerica TaxID=1804988 RepID=A0A5R9A6B6_9MICC|nr:hypothetical protein FEF27_09730 [Nesterenkonia sphaerica]
MGYRRDLWEIAAEQHGVVTIAEAEEAGTPAVEVRKLAHRSVLKACGLGVYLHRDVPASELTQPATAVALAGKGAFLQGETVLDLLGLGQFNPYRIRVGTRRRVRRALPEWIELETRMDVPDEDLTQYEGIPVTTVERALADLRERMPPERWKTLVDQARGRELIQERDVVTLDPMEHVR